MFMSISKSTTIPTFTWTPPASATTHTAPTGTWTPPAGLVAHSAPTGTLTPPTGFTVPTGTWTEPTATSSAATHVSLIGTITHAATFNVLHTS